MAIAGSTLAFQSYGFEYYVTQALLSGQVFGASYAPDDQYICRRTSSFGESSKESKQLRRRLSGVKISVLHLSCVFYSSFVVHIAKRNFMRSDVPL